MDEQQNVEPQPDRAAGDVSAQAVNVVGANARDVCAQTATLTRSGASHVKAENVIVRQGGAQKVEATNVTIQQGVVAQATAQTAEVVQSALALARADTLTLGPGSETIGVLANSATMNGALAQVVVARGPVDMEQSAAAALVAPSVTVKDSIVGLLFARHVEGDVRAMFGPRAAVAFGAAFGAAFGVAFALAQAARRRRRRG